MVWSMGIGYGWLRLAWSWGGTVLMPDDSGWYEGKPVFSLNLMDLSYQDLDTDPETLDSSFLGFHF
jgi:hypothetical protein